LQCSGRGGGNPSVATAWEGLAIGGHPAGGAAPAFTNYWMSTDRFAPFGDHLTASLRPGPFRVRDPILRRSEGFERALVSRRSKGVEDLAAKVALHRKLDDPDNALVGSISLSESIMRDLRELLKGKAIQY